MFFSDNTGKYVIGQPPNIPVYLIVLSFVIKNLLSEGWAYDLAAFIMSASVFLWAYLEIAYGESRFRRILGVIVMTFLLFGVANK